MLFIFYVFCFLFVCSKADIVIDKDKYEIVSDQNEFCAADEYYLLDHIGPFPQCVKIPALKLCNPCPPGYKCDNNECVMDEASCEVYHYKGGDPKNKYKNALWKPKCLEDGSFAPKQCKGEAMNGRCFCYSGDGKRIHGHEWSWKAENMTCACSRKRWELEQNMGIDDMLISLHCDDLGNYESLQCNSEQCWCAEPMTGKVISPVVAEQMIEFLPCYNETQLGSQYLRQCESQLYAQRKVIAEFKTHGTLYQNFPDVQCQADGSYGRYKIANSIVYCVWKDNTNLGSWNSQLKPSELSKINCNCAIDTRIYAAAGQSHVLACNANGSYEPMQMVNFKYYCVDADGFVKSREIPEVAVGILDCDDSFK